MLEDSDLNIHKGGDFNVFKTVSISLILPLIHCKYVVLLPAPNGMIYNANHLPTATAEFWECLELPLNYYLWL